MTSQTDAAVTEATETAVTILRACMLGRPLPDAGSAEADRLLAGDEGQVADGGVDGLCRFGAVCMAAMLEAQSARLAAQRAVLSAQLAQARQEGGVH